MAKIDSMRYTYDVYSGRIRKDTTDNFNQVEAAVATIRSDGGTPWVNISDGVDVHSSRELHTPEDVMEWRQTLERNFAWKPFDESETGIHLNQGLTAGDGFFAHYSKVGEPGFIKKPDPINPSHYQGYVKDMQWLEVMQYLPRFRDPDCFKASVELQARKYLDRLGQKDNDVQELLKSVWYIRFLAAYIKNGNKPIRVEEIDKLLS
jgi:hypothetical protein